MTKALIVIDVQKDYFPGGQFPLWNSEQVLERVQHAIGEAKSQDVPVILVQHIFNSANGPGPFFNAGTPGVEIHPNILKAADGAPIVVKEQADSFEKTTLEQTLSELGVDELLVCGMMTQNCVTHTAISKAAEKYDVVVLSDCCTTVSEILHLIALQGMAPRVKIQSSGQTS